MIDALQDVRQIAVTDLLGGLLRRVSQAEQVIDMVKGIPDRVDLLSKETLKSTAAINDIKDSAPWLKDAPSQMTTVVYPSPCSSFQTVDQMLRAGRHSDDDLASCMSLEYADRDVPSTMSPSFAQLRGDFVRLKQTVHLSRQKDQEELLTMFETLKTSYIQQISQWRTSERQLAAVCSQVGDMKSLQAQQQLDMQKVQQEHSGQVQQLQLCITEVATKCDLSEKRVTEYCGRLKKCETIKEACRERLALVQSAVSAYFQSVKRCVNMNFQQQYQAVCYFHRQELQRLWSHSTTVQSLSDCYTPQKSVLLPVDQL